ncbi:stage II sporulation protein P [Peribacillus butanolivorans]|uniref:stage II sporulation protein P n=1 Tax=Peribacillus butanolivorans TaxID=421767 RepID=UPI00364C658F
MQNDNEIFEEIKHSPDLNPRTEFVNDIRHLLIKKANHIRKVSKIKKLSYYWSVVIASVAMIAWTSLFGGNQYIVKSYHNVMSAFPKNKEEILTASNKNPSVFIYHTHNRESFMPLLKTKDPIEAQDKTKNITLVGAELSSKLNEKNINALHSDTDFEQKLRNRKLDYSKSYDISREEVQRALDKNKDLKLIIDIHRDTIPKEESTVKIDGKNYAKVVFYVSKANKTYFAQSLNLAKTLNDELEKMNPGLSRGVILKDSPNTYNQDIFPELALIGVGGPENTLEEEYRTIEKIAEVIQKITNE